MEEYTIARIIHILAIVLWIGGVAMVTTVIIPAVKKIKSKEDRINMFEQIEGKFAIQAKVTTTITAITGFYMLYLIDGWDRYFQLKYWWIHLMTLVWVLFTVVLFILEPFVLHKLFKKYANLNPDKTFSIMHKAHWILLLLSLLAIIGAVAGSHGLFFIE